MPAKTRRLYLNTLQQRQSGLILSAKWLVVFLLAGGLSAAFLKSFDESLAAAGWLAGLVSVAGLIAYDLTKHRGENARVAALSDEQLRAAYEHYLAAGGKPRPTGVTPGAWVGIGVLAASVAGGVVWAQFGPSTAKTHNRMVAAFNQTIDNARGKNPAEIKQAFRRFEEFVAGHDVSHASRRYREAFQEFRLRLARVMEAVRRLPDDDTFYANSVALVDLLVHREEDQAALKAMDQSFNKLRRIASS